jgi:curved DNA-binding protein CbpA
MKTLYDLLGALPHDDAEGLKTAFRQAVKGVRPDIRPGGPDAALKFRQIVRANEILTDAEQRAAYDHLLKLARLEPEWGSKNTIAGRIHKLASSVIALAGGSVMTVAGYLLFLHMSAASVAQANNVDVTLRQSRQIAAVSSAGHRITPKRAPSRRPMSARLPTLPRARLDPCERRRFWLTARAT